MTVEAFAKVNLSIEVLGRRPDGYHEIRSVVLPISLSDTLTLSDAAEGVFVSDSPYGESDLAVRAAKALAAGVVRRGVSISVVKRIPEGGGLGGGSADAAATLLALNEMWNLVKTPVELAMIGSSVGSDVPSLVLAQHFRRPVMMEGRGERVRVLGDEEIAALGIGTFVVLANPGIKSSTAEVYARCRPETYAGLWRVNDLQKPACELHPEIATLVDALSSAGAYRAMMSGSGATVFGFAEDEQSAERIAESMKSLGYVSFVASPLMAHARCRQRDFVIS